MQGFAAVLRGPGPGGGDGGDGKGLRVRRRPGGMTVTSAARMPGRAVRSPRAPPLPTRGR